MKREQLAEKILDIKREKGWSWKYITDEIGGMSPIFVVGALRGQMRLPKALAERAASLFGLNEGEKRMLNEVPARGSAMPPTDPLIYRLYELIMVNGPALKALIEEEFGDGIMSAIDFDLEFDRLANPRGDRVRLVMSGKFLPYKYYGAEQGGVRVQEKSDRGRALAQSGQSWALWGSILSPLFEKMGISFTPVKLISSSGRDRQSNCKARARPQSPAGRACGTATREHLSVAG